MKSKRAKVLHELGGSPLIAHVSKAAQALNPRAIFVVVGHQAEEVERAVLDEVGELASFVIQAEQRGTGHAVECARKTGLPVMVTVSFEQAPMTSDGKTPAECAKALRDAGADVVGINCLRSPEHTLPLVEQMRKAIDGPLACQPVRVARAVPTFVVTLDDRAHIPREIDGCEHLGAGARVAPNERPFVLR